MNLTHVSRFEMKKMLKNNEVPDNTLIISVNDTEDELSQIIDLTFELEYSQTLHFTGYVFADDGESFNEGIASDILNELESCIDAGINNIIVHCFAGLSRSAAIAKGINDYMNLNMDKYNNYAQHNLHVYNTLCKVSGVDNLRNYYKDLEDKE